MKKIDSFKIDHTRLQRGLYVSRIDKCGIFSKLTTFDIRLKAPYIDPTLTPHVSHTIEHMAATWIRNSSLGRKTVYFGPMGCMTGFYLILKGNINVSDVYTTIIDLFAWISNFEGDIPGATQKECGNYLLNDLDGAKKEAAIYLDEVLLNLSKENTNYPT